MERLKNTNHFIDFANNVSGSDEDYYNNWPINLLEDTPPLPKSKEIVSPISLTSIDTFLECFDENLCPNPDRMTKFIRSVRYSVRNILDGIVTNGGKLADSDDLKFFVDLQARYVETYQVVNGRLFKKTEVLGDDRWKFLLSAAWLSLVCWTLIDFL